MARPYMVMTNDEARKSGPYDERPMLPDDVDPQIHLSKNDRPQPFWLICEHDTMIATLSGEGRVEFKDSSVLHETYEMGDFIYIPAGTPSRILPNKKSIQYRYKATEAGLEGIAWYCEKCDRQLFREVWDTAKELSQKAFLRVIGKFNDTSSRRKCRSCGKVHPKIDLKGFRWEKIAQDLEVGTEN